MGMGIWKRQMQHQARPTHTGELAEDTHQGERDERQKRRRPAVPDPEEHLHDEQRHGRARAGPDGLPAGRVRRQAALGRERSAHTVFAASADATYPGIWGSEAFTSPDIPLPAYPEGFQGNYIPIDGEAVAELCIQRLTLEAEVDD
ncbi:hypothetical protein B0H10DRAFT_1284279 [Mycena sp. CBHHK59/15]|nr:hypothetical protein B0H10DRAFT_1284279 [Mycena sp. CBHHK59/15]